ncbi:hypothetical protein F0U60_43565 [Archangium minus]|uniref:Immunity protein 52 domain-containing protein n=1 Tax=Archangium minus TaxID=83450 RepID=A0ABY9X4E5_9BACT|nr:hypothetical protein F0U60_43565 [Archangium minus]
MVETYYAGAYWHIRKESPEECGRRAESFFKTLVTVDPSFSRWFKLGNSRKQAIQHPVETDQLTLEKMFRRGKDKLFEDLGFRLSGWNGEDSDDDACAFHIKCGGYAKEVGNRCLFQLPNTGPNAQRVLTAPVLTGLVRAMAMAWDPDDAIATSDSHRELVSKKGEVGPLVGWVTYLSRRRGTVPPLPAPVHSERVEDKGTLLVLTPERFTASNPEHIALAERVRELLERAGLLGPLR